MQSTCTSYLDITYLRYARDLIVTVLVYWFKYPAQVPQSLFQLELTLAPNSHDPHRGYIAYDISAYIRYLIIAHAIVPAKHIRIQYTQQTHTHRHSHAHMCKYKDRIHALAYMPLT